ncbi:MAG: biotin/lipoyl-containing protein, partial [Chromatiaceae bacterium]
MSSEVRVPALPESVADATVLAWHKAPGDSVKTGENLVDLETDKVVLEVPATMDGVLGPIQSPVGTVVTARTVLATIESAGLSAAAPSAAPRPGVSADTASGELTAVGPAT